MKTNSKIVSLGTAFLTQILALQCIAEINLDGSTGVAPGPVDLVNGTYEITQDLGNTSSNGTNLIHSFESFNVETGNTANFSGDPGVQNIIGRITGNNPSEIFGTVSSTIIDANLFLLNPNGIMFGPDASINISGSFYASTANNISDTDGAILSTNINDGLTLITAPPAAFGFTTETPAAITVNASQLAVNATKSITMIGGDISLTNAASLTASDGTISIASVASQGEVVTTGGNTTLNNFSTLGDINLSAGSNIDSSGSSAGRVVIRGGRLALDGSAIRADTTAFALDNTVANIDINTDTSVTIDNGSTISADLKSFAAGTNGGILLATNDLLIDNFSSLQTKSEFFSSGNAANVDLNVQNITLDNRSTISTSTGGLGNSGNITATGGHSLTINNGSSLTTSGDLFTGEGLSGDIKLNIDYITINGIVDTANYTLFDFTGIDAGGLRFGAGNDAGNIDITTKDLILNNNAQIRTAEFFGFNTGDITINSENITVASGSTILLFAVDNGVSGEIRINNSNNLLIDGASPNVELITNGYLPSSIIKSGGGDNNLNITTKSLTLTNGAFLSSKADGSNLASSNVIIEADSVTVAGVNQSIYDNEISKGAEPRFALEAARSSILASESITGLVSGNAQGRNSGSIFIKANDVEISDHAALIANSESDKNANILNDHATIEIDATRINIDNAVINTSSIVDNGGIINLSSSDYLVASNSTIIASVGNSFGNGGNINVASNLVVLNNNSLEATADAGSGGNINIQAHDLVVTQNNIFNVSSATSLNGQVRLTSDVEILGELSELPDDNIDVSGFFNDECSVAANKQHSSFASHTGSDSYLYPATIIPSDYTIDSTLSNIASNLDKQPPEVKNLVTNSWDVTPITRCSYLNLSAGPVN